MPLTLPLKQRAHYPMLTLSLHHTVTLKVSNYYPFNMLTLITVTPLHIAFALLSEEDQNSRLRTIFSKTAGDLVQFERSIRRQLVRLPSQVHYSPYSVNIY